MDLKHLVAEEATVDVDFGDAGTMKVTYRVGVNSLAQAAELLDLERTGNLSAVAELMVDLIAGWDLVDDGEPVPVTADAIKALPMFVLGKIMSAVTVAGRVGESNAAT